MTPALPRLRGGAAFALAMVPFAVLVGARWSWYPPSWAGDYAHYLLHAQALAQGRAYGDIGYLYHPGAWTIGPPSYPPALPVTLLPIVWAFGMHPGVLRLVAVAAVVLFAWFAYRRLARDMDVRFAAVAAGVTAFSIEVQLGALRPMSDPPFAALLWGTFLVADRPGSWTWGRVAAITALGFAAMAYRIPGIALIPALGLFALVHARRLGIRPFAPVIAWVGTGGVALALGVVQNPYADGVRIVQVFSPGRVDQVVANYRYVLSQATLYPSTIDGVNDAWHVVAWLLAVPGLGVLLWSIRRSLVTTFALAYGAMLLAAPVADMRYAWPLVPLIVVGLMGALATSMRRAGAWLHRDALSRHAAPIALAIMAVVGLGALGREVRAEPPRSLEGNLDAEDMFSFLRTQTGARVMFHNPRVLTLRTGNAAMGLLERTAPGQLVGIDEKQLTHFVWQRPDISPCAQRIANELVERYPERFRLAYRNATFRVYAIVRADRPFDGAFDVVNWSRADSLCSPARRR